MGTAKQLAKALELPANARLAIYGAGGGGRALRAFLETERADLQVAFFVDAKPRGEIDGIVCVRPEELSEHLADCDLVLVASRQAEQIEAELHARGVEDYWVCTQSLLAYAVACENPEENHPGWYLETAPNFMPSRSALFAPDGLERFVLDGYLPAAPFITRETCVTPFGSCFAGHIRRHLVRQGYRLTGEDLRVSHGYRSDSRVWQEEQAATRGFNDKAYVFHRPATFNNTFAIRQQFEWAFEDATFTDELWFDSDKTQCRPSGEARAATRVLFERTDVFIISVGLAEIWENIETREVAWRAIPAHHADPDKHHFRVSTVDENTHNLERVYEMVRRHLPNARIILTLSPVPLDATFRGVSCVTANAVSKAILRVAIDTVWRRHAEEGALFYWPSYEIIKEATLQPYDEDNRHITPETVEAMMSLFSRHYLVE